MSNVFKSATEVRVSRIPDGFFRLTFIYKIHTRFQTSTLSRNYVTISQIKAQTNNFSKCIGPRNAPFDFPLTLNNFSKYEDYHFNLKQLYVKITYLYAFPRPCLPLPLQFFQIIKKNKTIYVYRSINPPHMG